MQKTWLCAAKVQLGLAHRTVRWCTGQCLVRQAGLRRNGCSRESTAMYVYNSPDCPVSHPRRTRRPREKQRGDVAIIHRTVRWCTGLSGEPTVACACPVRQSAQRSKGRICQIWKEIAHRTVYRTCLVRHSTEGRNCLPSWPPTAPSCLGAIKGTPRRKLEDTQAFTKHSKNPTLHLRAFDRLC